MKNIVLCSLFSLLTVMYYGCSLISEGFGEAKKTRNQICKVVEDKSMKNLKYKDFMDFVTNKSNSYKVRSGMGEEVGGGIVDYKTGKVTFTVMRENQLIRNFYCPYFKPIKTVLTETKSFAVNGSGNDDFKVKVIKEVVNAKKLQKDKVLDNDVQIISYRLEKEDIMVVSYKDRLYLEKSSFIKNERQRLQNEFQKKRVALQVPCFKMGGGTYCDGDLVNLGPLLMFRISEVGGGSVRWKLYFYNGNVKEPTEEANRYNSGYYYSELEMKAREVIGNDYLKQIVKYEISQPTLLSLKDIKTFKEW